MQYKDEGEFQAAFVREARAAKWVITEIENKFGRYISDIAFSYAGVSGWVEVKWLRRNPLSLQAIPHLRAGQRTFLQEHGGSGSGHCYLLLGTPLHAVVWPWQAMRRGFMNLSFDEQMRLRILEETSVEVLVDSWSRRIRNGLPVAIPDHV